MSEDWLKKLKPFFFFSMRLASVTPSFPMHPKPMHDLHSTVAARSRGRASSNIDTGLSTGTKTAPTQPLTTTTRNRNNIDIEATGKLERSKG